MTVIIFTEKRTFPLGDIGVTSGAVEKIPHFQMLRCLARHSARCFCRSQPVVLGKQ